MKLMKRMEYYLWKNDQPDVWLKLSSFMTIIIVIFTLMNKYNLITKIWLKKYSALTRVPKHDITKIVIEYENRRYFLDD